MSDWYNFLYEAEVFQTGTFRLKSGKESPYFLNFGRIDSGRNLTRMGQFFAQAILDHDLRPDLLFGPAYKGLPLAVATSMEYARLSGRDLPYCSFRKEAKQHGDAGLVLGRAPNPEARIVMIDDVLTTSATKVEAIAELARWLGAPPQVVAVVVGVDRQERTPQGSYYAADFTAATVIPLVPLCTIRQLLDNLQSRAKISADTHQRCLEAL